MMTHADISDTCRRGGRVAEVAELLRKREDKNVDVPRQHPRQQFSLQDSVDRWHATVGSLGGHAEAVTVVCTADRPLTSSLLNKMVRNLLDIFL